MGLFGKRRSDDREQSEEGEQGEQPPMDGGPQPQHLGVAEAGQAAAGTSAADEPALRAAPPTPARVYDNPLAVRNASDLTAATAVASASSNSSIGVPTPPHVASTGSSSNPGEFQTHLRKMTANLLDIIDQMSTGAAAPAPAAAGEPRLPPAAQC